MKKLSVLFVSMFLTMQAQADADAAAGKALTAACGACHGADGNSVNPAWPKLAGQGEKYLLKQLQDIKSNARAIPEMTGQLTNMSDQDMANVAAYYASLPGTGSAAANDAEQLKLGEQVYRAGVKDSGISACTACHSPTGNGNALAGFPRLSGQHAAYIEAQMQKFQSGARNNDAEAVMRDIAKRMTAAEIKAVSNYAAGLRE